MPRSSSNADDDLDSANRRSSGRARKLTAKYQALTGTKYLPADSPNQSYEDSNNITNSSSPDEHIDVVNAELQLSNSRVRAGRRPAKHQLTDWYQEEPSDDDDQEQPLSELVAETLEQPATRSLRRERKPSTKAREAQEAHATYGKSMSPNADLTQVQPPSPLLQASAHVKELVSFTVPDLPAPQTTPTVDSTGPTIAIKTEQRSVSPIKATSPPQKVSSARKRPRTSAGTFARADGSVASGKKRARSAKFSQPQTASSSLVADDPSPESPPSQEAPPVNSRDLSNVPKKDDALDPATNESDGIIFHKADEFHVASQALSPAESTGRSRRRPAVEGASREPPAKVAKLTLNPPKRPNPPRRPSNLRFSISSADQPPVPQPNENLGNMNGVWKAEQQQKKARKVPARGKERAVLTKRPSKPTVTTENRSAECNLFCLSPSARILAFAQLAAESSDSDDDEDDDFDLASAAPGGLYNKWLAKGRERFCVCSSKGQTHAHPAPTVRTPCAAVTNVVSSRVFPLPPVNSIMSSADDQKVSPLYNALVDTQMPLGLIRRTPFD